MSESPKTAVVPEHLTAAYELVLAIGRMSHDQDDGGNDYDLDAEHDKLQRLIEQARDIMSMPSTALANRDPQGGEAWRPIETHDGSIEKVLIYDPRFGVCEGLWFRSGYWRMASFTSSRIRALPTHWMPLPASPQDDRMGEGEAQ